MVVLEWILYVVCVLVAYAAFRFNWWLFPKKMSRRERWRTSDYDFFTNRALKSFVAGLVIAYFGIAIVYAVFNDGKFILDNSKYVISKQQKEAASASSGTVDGEASQWDWDTGKEVARAVVQQWDDAHNGQDYEAFRSLYAGEVAYYGQRWTGEECVGDKRKLLGRYAVFSQRSDNFRFEAEAGGRVKVSFDKHVRFDGEEKTFPSYLVIGLSEEGKWIIERESDEITDRNLAKRRKGQ